MATYSVILHELTEHVVQVEVSSIKEARYNAECGWQQGWYVDDNAQLIELNTVRVEEEF